MKCGVGRGRTDYSTLNFIFCMKSIFLLNKLYITFSFRFVSGSSFGNWDNKVINIHSFGLGRRVRCVDEMR